MQHDNRIVVIDDDPLVLATVAEYLRAAGYQVGTSDCPIKSNRLIDISRSVNHDAKAFSGSA